MEMISLHWELCINKPRLASLYTLKVAVRNGRRFFYAEFRGVFFDKLSLRMLYDTHYQLFSK